VTYRTLTALMMAGILLVAVAVAACGGSDEERSSDGEDAAMQDDGPASESGDEVVIHVHAEKTRFDPEVISVAVGQKVRLTLDNHDPILHDYTTDDPEFVVYASEGAEHGGHADATRVDGQVSLRPLHVAADAEQHADLLFEATEAGEYVFYCSVTGHQEGGMVGTIVVTG